MSANVDLVKRLVTACEAKDFDAVRNLLADDYRLKDPTMNIQGKEEMIAMLKSCPMDGSMKNAEYLDAGDRVVLTADCAMTQPKAFTWRVCDVVTIKNGKVAAEEMFYDTAQLPKEVIDQIKASATGGGKKKAA